MVCPVYKEDKYGRPPTGSALRKGLRPTHGEEREKNLTIPICSLQMCTN